MEETKGRERLIEDDDSESSSFLLLLPPEINTEILSRLPGDSAIGCRVICKPWRSLIDHPSFLDTHTRQLIDHPKRFGNYLIPTSSSTSGLFLCAYQYNMKFSLRFVEYNDHVDDGQKIVSELKPSKSMNLRRPFHFYIGNWGILLMSSCNGLVFMGSTKPNYENDMFICNPFTREYLNLRTKEEERPRRCQCQLLEGKGCMSYGFGYLASTNEYKIVSIYYPDETRGGKGEVNVCTLGSGSRWRNKGEITYWLYNAFHPGVFANGAIHWFNYADKKKKKIVTFDLADEEFRMVVPSPPRELSTNHVSKLGVLGGCLCVIRSDKTRCESPKHVWVLNVHTTKEEGKEGKEKFSWNKRFIIPWKGTIDKVEPCVILKSGKVLLLGSTGLISYDPKTGAFNEGDDGTISLNARLKVIPYTKSFVSLKALGEDAICFGKFVSHALAQQQHWQNNMGNWWLCCMSLFSVSFIYCLCFISFA